MKKLIGISLIFLALSAIAGHSANGLLAFDTTHIPVMIVYRDSPGGGYSAKWIKRTTTPAPVPPTVSAGTDKEITLPTVSTTLTGTASANNPGGSIASTTWSVVSNPAGASPDIGTPSTLSTTVSDLSVEGTYVFKLTAIDNLGLSSSDNVTVTVNAASPGQSVLFNFNATAQNITNTVDVTGAPGTAVVTATDPTTGWAITSIATGGGLWTNFGPTTSDNGNGSTVDDGGGFVFGADVTKSSWYSTAFHQFDGRKHLKIYNLEVGKTYKITILSSISSSSGAPTVDTSFFQVNGSAYRKVYPVNNTSDTLQFPGSVPDASGQIFIGGDANVSSGTSYYFIINGVKIEEE